MTIAQWLRWGRACLDSGLRAELTDGMADDMKDSLVDAEALLSAAIGKSTAEMIAAADWVVPDCAAENFQSLVRRRAHGEPVAYLLGQKEFWSLMLSITPDVLIPRAETELVVEETLARLAGNQATHKATILELGSGSGAIAIALASELPRATIVATDNAPAALKIAAHNARKLALESIDMGNIAMGNIEFRLGDWFHAVAAQRFDIIIANPPYIATDDHHLKRGDLRFEPRAALVSKSNGLADLKQIITTATSHLNANGMLLVEHGYEQASAVRSLFQQHQFTAITTRRDISGNERVTGGRVGGG